VLSYGEVDLFELRGTSFPFPYCGCSPFYEVGDEDPEACGLFSFTVGALFFIRTMLLAPEADSVFHLMLPWAWKVYR